MTDRLSTQLTAFAGHDLLARGAALDVALAVRGVTAEGRAAPVLVFDDASGRVVDLDLRGSADEIAARLAAPPPSPRGRFRAPPEASEESPAAPASKPRGRPRLGVVSREVTLLPRQWEWLASQRGGASAALRRLVEAARKAEAAEPRQRLRHRQEAAYSFLQAIAGDFPRYEEVTRALFSGDLAACAALMQGWPEAISAHALRLAGADGGDTSGAGGEDG